MNTFLGFFVLILLVDHSLCINRRPVRLPQEASGVLMGAIQQCISQTGVSMEALLKVPQGGYSEGKKFKDFIYCSYKTSGYLKPDGQLDTEKSMSLFRNDPEVAEGIRRCAEASGKNAKDTVFNFFKCFQDTVPVFFTL